MWSANSDLDRPEGHHALSDLNEVDLELQSIAQITQELSDNRSKLVDMKDEHFFKMKQLMVKQTFMYQIADLKGFKNITSENGSGNGSKEAGEKQKYQVVYNKKDASEFGVKTKIVTGRAPKVRECLWRKI